MWWTKLNSSGVLLNDTVFDFTNSTYPNRDDDYANSIHKINEDEILFTGYTDYFDTEEYQKGILLKLNNYGNQKWLYTVENGGNFGSDRYTRDVATNNAKDHFLIGSDYLHKVDSNGTNVWEQGLFPYDIYGNSILILEGKFIYVIGREHGGFSSDYSISLTKFDTSGNMHWSKLYGGLGQQYATSSAKTSNGDIIITGVTDTGGTGDISSYNGMDDIWFLKVDSSGSVIWEKTFGGSEDDISTSMSTTSDGGFIVSGHTSSSDGDVSNNHGASDFWVLKIDNSGNLIWERTYGGSDDDEATSVLETSGGNYLVAGKTNSDDTDVSNNYGVTDIWVVKIEGNTSKLSEESSKGTFNLHPNPTKGQFLVQTKSEINQLNARILDLNGKVIESKSFKNTRNFRMDFNGAPGVYFIDIQTDNGKREVLKIMKE